MLRKLFFLLTFAFSIQGHAKALCNDHDELAMPCTLNPFILLSATTVLPSINATEASGTIRKEILDNAKDDAAIFVASEGEIRGVQLDTALQLIRSEIVDTDLNDFELTLMILENEI